jgi:hypothetical protein
MLIAHAQRPLLALMLIILALAVSACVADRPPDPDFARHSATPYVGYH